LGIRRETIKKKNVNQWPKRPIRNLTGNQRENKAWAWRKEDQEMYSTKTIDSNGDKRKPILGVDKRVDKGAEPRMGEDAL